MMMMMLLPINMIFTVFPQKHNIPSIIIILSSPSPSLPISCLISFATLKLPHFFSQFSLYFQKLADKQAKNVMKT